MYADRMDAGRRLAAALESAGFADPSGSLVLGLPRGGVPVGAEVARALRTPLDVLVVRKVGVPFDPEFAIGAVGEDGVVVLDTEMANRIGIDDRRLRELVDEQQREVLRRTGALRARFPRLPLDDLTVLIVDDGLATGATAAAAVEVARSHGPARVVVAAPVGSATAVAWLESLADAVVCPLVPSSFTAVGNHYADFAQVSDDEVEAAMAGLRVAS